MLSEHTFLDSFTRIFGSQIKLSEHGDQFFDSFYATFKASSPEVAAVFQKTDMQKQKTLLRKSLLYSINFITNANNFDSMRKIAISHNKQHYNIKPELYDLWLDCMVLTVQKFDPVFDDDVELAWRLAFAPGITYMKFMYSR
jgi:hemoglobin-like flavoprotein